jgi:hypothetical protein
VVCVAAELTADADLTCGSKSRNCSTSRPSPLVSHLCDSGDRTASPGPDSGTTAVHCRTTGSGGMDRSILGRHSRWMAKTTTVNITDDLDGSKGAIDVSFSWGGVDYTIDLSKKNIAAMEKALKPYVDAATKVSGRSGPAARRKAPRPNESRKDTAKVREWARQQGLEISDRGRVPASIVEQYDAAN